MKRIVRGYAAYPEQLSFDHSADSVAEIIVMYCFVCHLQQFTVYFCLLEGQTPFRFRN